jgi:F0F1-type ATP synthase alpha subunit
MSVEQQVVVIFAATKGYLDSLQIGQIADYEAGLLKSVDAALLQTIKNEGVLSEQTMQKLAEFCEKYTQQFKS